MSPPIVVWVLLVGSASAVIGAWGWRRFARPWQEARRHSEVERVMRLFRLQREQLEAKFLDLAQASGKPRGLRWLNCDWQNEVTFARACDTGMLTAFVGLNIRFEAVEGGDMEGIPHVDNLRDAAAVFHFQNGRWSTVGKALFNMNPNDAVTRLVGQFDPVV